MHPVCPGARFSRQPKPEIFKCPYCGEEVEIWTDEIKATCPNCKKTVFKVQNQTCLEWCKLAKECVGESIYNTYVKNRSLTIKKSLLKEISKYFENDTKKVIHAKKVLKFAEKLLTKENGDWHIVIPAAILHDIGIKSSKKENNSKSERYQQKESISTVRKMLLKLGLKLENIDEICKIISYHHTPDILNTNNYKILYDADQLENFKDRIKESCKSRLKEIINDSFLTETGKKTAEEIYLNQS